MCCDVLALYYDPQISREYDYELPLLEPPIKGFEDQQGRLATGTEYMVKVVWGGKREIIPLY